MLNQKEILEFLASNRESFRENFSLSRVGIFGSVARGEAKDQSDLDLIIEFHPDVENIHSKKRALRKLLEDRFHVHVDICREKCIKPIFRDDILKEAIYVE